MVRHGLSILGTLRFPTPVNGPGLVAGLALLIALGLPGLADAQGLDRTSWTVDHTWTSTRDVEFDVTEGTWMNLDVSPDGRMIVFDMLGDLYTMPIGGGRAARIAGGPAFDFQPRFSPDGRRIAFVSDRDGLNNIWTVAIDGSDPRQVTKETARDVNSPVWSVDGEYIFVRKHFVFSRSLGAGEIWMYHRSGGSGIQVTDRPNEQQDQGEPAVSPDGEWLYYSQDVTPGPLFQYNKDPNPGIYSIRRRNLRTGEQETVSRRPGGSVTPTPHPDGRRLAFVRRVRTSTVLFIRDMETGEEWPVWDGLERDMQEAWAIHGVYTDFAWVPGTDELLIWAQGKIWRVDTATGQAAEVPFSAAVDQRVQTAVRHDVELAGDAFDVKMLRHVHTSPDGRRVTFSALGRVWVKDMPNGAPRRLTTSEDVEAFPQFSPDGTRIVYVSWDDEDKGRVRVAPASGGEGVDIVGRPGHYVEPSWAPNSRWVVFRSVAGDSRRGPTHGEMRGIMIAPADGAGAPWKVRDGGSSPAYNADGTRVFFTEGSQSGVRLMSSDLNGQEEITHLTGTDITEWVVSPDGAWIAFVEGWRTYIAPFPRPGRPVAVSKDSKSYPVAQASREAGAYLHWAGDSRQLHWSQGPNYYTRDLAETFTFVEGGAEQPAEPESEGQRIGFRAPADVPSGIVAFVGGRIITSAVDPSAHGAQDGVIENGTVVVSGNRITAVGPSDRVNVPTGAHRVDARGKTLMPGMIDAHAHVGSAGSGLPAEADWPLLANLAFGVTTSHDPSNSTEMVFTDAEMIRAGMKLGPRLLSTGTILYGAETPFRSQVTDYEDALMHVRRQKAAGAPSVKSYNQRRRDARQWILQAADAEGINVVPEGGSTLFQNLAQVIDGHTTVEHNLPAANLYDDVVGLWAATEVAYTPTLIVGYGGLSGEFFFYERYDVWTNERLMNFTPRDVVDPRSRRRLKAAGDEDYNHIALARHVNELNQAGVLTNVGAHGQLQGLGAHWELWMFVQGGMSELDAIRSATINPALSLGLDEDLGSIEEGKLADLLVLNGNPLEDINESESIGLVMVNGRLYDAMTLFETGNYSSPRPTLWFERIPPMTPSGGAPQ
jgi:Tol biopolymer transport system component/imidazolonepropionase-like amidohydrolase